jgi:hypothetical protein
MVWAGSMAQTVELPPLKNKALNSNPTATKKYFKKKWY